MLHVTKGTKCTKNVDKKLRLQCRFMYNTNIFNLIFSSPNFLVCLCVCVCTGFFGGRDRGHHEKRAECRGGVYLSGPKVRNLHRTIEKSKSNEKNCFVTETKDTTIKCTHLPKQTHWMNIVSLTGLYTPSYRSKVFL